MHLHCTEYHLVVCRFKYLSHSINLSYKGWCVEEKLSVTSFNPSTLNKSPLFVQWNIHSVNKVFSEFSYFKRPVLSMCQAVVDDFEFDGVLVFSSVSIFLLYFLIGCQQGWGDRASKQNVGRWTTIGCCGPGGPQQG